MPGWFYVDCDGDPIPPEKLNWRDLLYQTLKFATNVADSVTEYIEGVRNLVAGDANHHMERRAFIDEARADIESLDFVDDEADDSEDSTQD